MEVCLRSPSLLGYTRQKINLVCLMEVRASKTQKMEVCLMWDLYNFFYRKFFGKRLLVEVLDKDGNFVAYTWGREHGIF